MSATPFPGLPAIAYSAFGSEVFFGLTARPKTLSPWLFYDSAGSQLFEAITELPEYYLTRTERGILSQNAGQIISAAADGRRLSIFELGAGTATKTGLLLEAAVKLQGRVTYRAIDVSESALQEAKTRLEAEIDGVTVKPEVADYTTGHLDLESAGERRLVMYIGSSIGNFAPEDALSVLRTVRARLAPGDGLLLGVDMVKDRKVLLAAYDDSAEVTAAFNKNLLVRINRELDANFELELFRHRVIWDVQQSRVEMHLESLMTQEVRIGALDLTVHFAMGETIHTENSYKFTNLRVAQMLRRAGFVIRQQWSDPREWFGVYLAIAV
ncbi:MAG TPA: L-histidine N(alpha)-methyltransferase [Acidobacteriaceae bacterium]|jgi:dimethylhistidine N-methyltransferase